MSQHEHARRSLTRRQLLAAGLTAGAVAGTGGWRSAGGLMSRAGSRAGTHLPRALRAPGSRPYPHLAAGTDTIPQIKHIVVLMMENHSYDNHLGLLRRAGADGFTLGPGGKPTAANPYADGRIQHAFPMPNTCQQFGHPSQTWANSHTQFDGGKLDGFVKSGSGPVAMGYWDSASLPFYYSMASVFPIADRYFCSVLGQTYPNRRYLMAATSLGLVDDNILQLVDYPANGTIFDRLHGAGVTWTDYYSALSPTPTIALFPELLVRYPSHLAPVSGFFSAAAAGTLPGFCLVEPNYGLSSEEDPQDIALGEQFAAKVVNAVMSGPGWPNTLLIWTFDEHGGYYDHVVPPAALAPDNIPPNTGGAPAYHGFAQYGFRVPCAVISPWARADYVSHRVFDHTSILALVEAKWNLAAMTRRHANANNMLDMLDLSAVSFAKPPALARPRLDTDPGALTCLVTGPGTIPPADSVSPAPG
ncbi:MAG: alkaline phosphatase family protein [Streptosporangiales bacterium]